MHHGKISTQTNNISITYINKINGAHSEGIRRVLEEMTGIPHPRGKPVDTFRIQSIRMGM
jgi:5-oxoprolinase (ATP-hydrolysing)